MSAFGRFTTSLQTTRCRHWAEAKADTQFAHQQIDSSSVAERHPQERLVSPTACWATAPRAVCARLLVAYFEHLVLPHPARSLHLDLVPGGPADQRPRNGRADRDLAFSDVGFVVSDDLVGHRLSALGLLEIDGGAEHAPPLGVDPLRVDDLCVGKLALDLLDPGFDEALALF